MKKLKKIIAFLCVVCVIFGSPVISSAAQTDFTSHNCDIENIRYIGSVRDQGEKNDCIIYALISAAETYVLKNDNDIENHKNGEEPLMFDIEILENSVSTTNEFSKIIRECREVPMTDDEAYYYISSCSEIDVSGGSIKKAVYENGAAVITFGISSSMSDKNYYSEENFSYYGGGEINHAVSVIGWDDNYSKENFANEPETDGAWVCRNSYGEEYGRNGVFYLSYEQEIKSAAKLELNYDNGDGTETRIAPSAAEGGVERVVSVNLTFDGSGNRIAFADTADGKTVRCSFKKDFTSGIYVVKLPDTADYFYYFDKNTAVIFNGDIIENGITGSSNTEFEVVSDNTIHIISKETGGFRITGIKMPKYDLGYIRLTYDDGSEALMFEGSFERKGITVKKHEVEDNSAAFGELREVGKCEYYTEISFDGSFAFDENVKITKGQDDSEYIINELNTGSELDSGSELVVITRSLTAEIEDQGIFAKLIAAFFSIFGKLAFILIH